jgi:hypothetical protein
LEGLEMEDVGIFTAILSIIRPNGIFYDVLVHFVVIWYIFSRFGMMYREQSGNPAAFEPNKIFGANSIFFSHDEK